MKNNTELYDLLKELDNLLSISNKDHEEKVALNEVSLIQKNQ